MFYFASEAEKQRAVNAYRVRGGAAGYESMSDLVMAWVPSRKSEANAGQPFGVERGRRVARRRPKPDPARAEVESSAPVSAVSAVVRCRGNGRV